jgi:proline iminopeptidase
MDLEKWTVFGGSWGSTLALAYASKHMNRVTAMVLRGIYLGEPHENAWLYKEGGASELKPVEWARFVKGSGSRKGCLIGPYRRLLRNRRTRKAAAKAWTMWETSISSMEKNLVKDSPKEVEMMAVLENHYFSHNCWLRPGQLLREAKRIPRSIPVYIIQGEYDLVCPPMSAVRLSKAIRHSHLQLTQAGHAALEPATAAALKKALSKLE